VDEIINAKFLELQHNRAEVGAQDLRVCVVLHLLLVCLLSVQSASYETSGTFINILVIPILIIKIFVACEK
jgi:hypothetical protein